MKPRILNVEPEGFDPAASALLREAGELHEERCDRARLIALLGDFDALILRFGHRIDAEMLEHAGRLRVIACPATGTEHIDEEAARRRGIHILSLRNDRAFLESVTATAELSWALLLMAARRLPQAMAHVRAAGWNRDLFQGIQLRAKTLGVIGYGRLGRMVANYGLTFGMRVLACDPYVDTADASVTLVPLNELLAQADAVSLHVGLNKESTGLLGPDAFAAMKRGCILVNTARGELIDEAALLQALDRGIVGAAGLDVLAGEALKPAGWPQGSPVWQRAQTDERLILTPHIGGKTVDSNRDAEIHIARKLARDLDARRVDAT